MQIIEALMSNNKYITLIRLISNENSYATWGNKYLILFISGEKIV